LREESTYRRRTEDAVYSKGVSLATQGGRGKRVFGGVAVVSIAAAAMTQRMQSCFECADRPKGWIFELSLPRLLHNHIRALT